MSNEVLAGDAIEFNLLRTSDPDDAISLRAFLRAGGGGLIDIGRRILPAGVRNFVQLPPENRFGARSKLFSEILILLARAGHDGDERASIRDDVFEILLRAQLAIGHIDELIRPDEMPKQVGVTNVNRVVRPVSAEDVMQEGDRAIGGDIEPEQELLEIGPVILVDASRDAWLGSGGIVLSEK